MMVMAVFAKEIQIPDGVFSNVKVPNGELFYWYKKHPTSKDLVIWMNGGPGCSSLFGLFFEHSWDKHVNIVFLDQPVGTGFSKKNKNATNDIIPDFVEWFSEFKKLYPHNRIFLSGESFAGYQYTFNQFYIYKNNIII